MSEEKIKVIGDIVIQVERLHALYLEKYEHACVYRANDNAVRFEGALMALEHLLINMGKGSIISQRRSEVEERRNKMVKVFRKEMENE